MLRRCLSCYRPFEANDILDQLPFGRRVACDPARGRLWVICGWCARWSLLPLETRWETLDQLEALASGEARLLKRGENIALFQAGPIEIVRVGKANAREQAWWRYGSEFGARRRHARAVANVGKAVDALIMLAVCGVPFWGHSDSEHWIRRSRARNFGPNAWRGLSVCPGCGHVLRGIRFEEEEPLHLAPDRDAFALWHGCPACRTNDPATGHRLTGVTAEHVLRRVLAYRNFAGGTERGVAAALAVVTAHETPAALLSEAAGRLAPLRQMTEVAALATEIALNDSLEARLLEHELAALERRWREEEALAAIIDGELTPLPDATR